MAKGSSKSAANKRRAPNEPWKGIYGKDRKYTARVDRAKARESNRARVD